MERFVHAEHWAVGTVGRHGFDHIRHGDDLGLKKDFVSGKSVGVAGPVEPLMMLEDDVRDRPGELNAFKDIIPDLRVDLDEVHFGIAQFRGLCQ